MSEMIQFNAKTKIEFNYALDELIFKRGKNLKGKIKYLFIPEIRS